MAALDRRQRALIESLLTAAFGRRLRGVLLFGSEARGEPREDSDVDILVVLAGPASLGRDLRAAILALQPLQIELDRPLHPIPVAEDVFAAGEYALYREVRARGVAP